jgi:hypothetical protein
MKILFIMDSPEYLRFYDSVIEECAARGHDVSLAVSHGREKKPVGVEGLQAYADRVRVLGVVPQHDGVWGEAAFRLRAVMDFLRYLHPAFAEAPALRARMKRKVLPAAYAWLNAIPSLPPAAVRAGERLLMAADRAIPTSEPMVAFLREQAPDVLLVSPLVAAASEQVDWIKAAHACGIRTAVCIASWDNLTNKGLMRIEPDLVVVWNDAQKREAQDYHYIPTEKIVTTGAQLFDRWFVKHATRGRDEFCARAGLPDARPFVLFTGSSSFISRSNVEVPFVRKWIAALRASDDPLVRDVRILIRPHPYNYREWDSAPLADMLGVAVYPPRGYNPVDEDNRADFFDSIYHSAAVVGVNTSAMIEAAIIGRPVFSLLTEEFAHTQEGTIHFHHLLPENGGFLRIAPTIDAHVLQLSDCLRNPAQARSEVERFAASFIRPHGIERPATPIFVDAIERLAAMPRRESQVPSVWAPAVRPAILAASALAATVDWLRDDPLTPMRKRFGMAVHHARKTVNKTALSASSRIRRRVKLAGKQWQKSVVKPLRARR